MKVEKEEVQILPTAAVKEQTGETVEPEQVPARKVQTVESTVEYGGQMLPGINTQIIAETSAGELASGFRNRCGHCKHFDVAGANDLMRKARLPGADPELRRFRELVEAYLLGEDATLDVLGGDSKLKKTLDSAVMGLGLCRALTELMSAHHKEFFPFMMAEDAGCPDYPGPNGEDLDMFKPRDRKAAREGATEYDRLLGLALGKGIK